MPKPMKSIPTMSILVGVLPGGIASSANGSPYILSTP